MVLIMIQNIYGIELRIYRKMTVQFRNSKAVLVAPNQVLFRGIDRRCLEFLQA
jgi:hypothetical protein